VDRLHAQAAYLQARESPRPRADIALLRGSEE
jgi:hypothetical protein